MHLSHSKYQLPVDFIKSKHALFSVKTSTVLLIFRKFSDTFYVFTIQPAVNIRMSREITCTFTV